MRRLEAGSVELHPSDIVLADALGGMEELIAPQLQSKGVSYEYHPCDRRVRVYADREKLDQILLNLVGNAVKFTERGGRISLRCESDAERVRIIVADTGRGIPRAKLESIFDPFVQVDRHLTPERQQGVGLGLAISRDLARAMQGDISAQSDAGPGRDVRAHIAGVRSRRAVSWPTGRSRTRLAADSNAEMIAMEDRRASRVIVHGAVTLLKRQPMLWMIPPSARIDAPFVTAARGLAT